MRGGPILVIGDALLDVDIHGDCDRLCPDAPVPVIDCTAEHDRPGGAALAALSAAWESPGREVHLLTALSDDSAGYRIRDLLDPGVRTYVLALDGPTPRKVRVHARDRSMIRLDFGDGRARHDTDTTASGETIRDIVGRAGAILISDYGRGMAAHPEIRAALEAVPAGVPIVWDPHPRGPEPLPGVRLVTPNDREAERLAPDPEPRVTGAPTEDASGDEGSDAAKRLRGAAMRAGVLARRWRAAGVSVTLGEDGALLSVGDGTPYLVPPRTRVTGDPCGAGDRFAATATVALARGALLPEAVAAGVEGATSFLADGGVAALNGTNRPPAEFVLNGAEPGDDALALADRVRRAGGTVVATGGCFDILHAGHVELLRRARALGDCLVVCLNSDDSVRRLKGDDRPLVSERDRARVVRAVAGVDAVVVFGDDTPVPLLERLRPDVWVKGGDYENTRLPEAAVVRRLGGQPVVLPYLDGRSTSSIVAAARGRE